MFSKEESKKARKRVIRYLVYRDRSRHEIICYLKRKNFPANVVHDTLVFLEENDYINDKRFAIQFGKSRIENKKLGKLRLERELDIKGIEKKVATEALNLLYEEYDEMEIAISCAKKKLLSSSSTNSEKERGRLANFLKRKGFPTDIIYKVVTNLVQYASNTNLTICSNPSNNSPRKSNSLTSRINQR